MKKNVVFALSTALMLAGMGVQAAETEAVTEAVTEVTETEAVTEAAEAGTAEDTAEEAGEVTVSLDEISEANLLTNVFQKYDNVYMECRNFTDPFSYRTVVASPDTYYFAENGQEEYIADGKLHGYYLNEDGSEQAYYMLNADGSAVMSTDCQSFLVYYDSSAEQITSSTQEGTKLYLNTKVDAAAEALPYYADQMQDGDYAEFEAVLDAETLVMYSNAEYLVHADGSRKLLQYTVFNYDVEGLDAADMMSENINEIDAASDGIRTVTAIMNPGTEEENVNAVEIPKGESIGFFYDHDEYESWLDEAGTIPVTEAGQDYDSDITLYFIKK